MCNRGTHTSSCTQQVERTGPYADGLTRLFWVFIRNRDSSHSPMSVSISNTTTTTTTTTTSTTTTTTTTTI